MARSDDDQSNAWDLLIAGRTGFSIETIEDLMAALDQSSHLRSASLLLAIERCRNQLIAHGADADLNAVVTLSAADVVVMIRALLARLR